MDEPEVDLPGGLFTRVARRGRVVLRSQGPWSGSVHAYLAGFEARGIDFTPRYLGTEGDREVLSHVEGTPGHYPLTEQVRSEAALRSVAAAVRRFHDASTDMTHISAGCQHHTAAPVGIDCIGHHDLGPWNIVFDCTEVAGIIDWDQAGPSNRLWDLAYAAHRFVPLSSPAVARRAGWPSEPDRRERLAVFVAAYGEPATPGALVDLAIVRLGLMAANIEREVARGNPAFEQHAREGHADGYREDLAYLATARAGLVG